MKRSKELLQIWIQYDDTASWIFQGRYLEYTKGRFFTCSLKFRTEVRWKYPITSCVFGLLKLRSLYQSWEIQSLNMRCVTAFHWRQLLCFNNDRYDIQVERGIIILEMGEWLTQPPEPWDNCIWLLQQTQRRRGVEWEDNGRGHQSISGGTETLYTECSAITVIGASCPSHNPCPLTAYHTVKTALISGDSVLLTPKQSSCYTFLHHPCCNNLKAHNS